MQQPYLHAQMMLPGALQALPSGAGQPAPKPSEGVPKKPKPARSKPPSEETVLSHELSRDGFAGTIAFQSVPGNGIAITRLLLAGEEISHPLQQCQVDVVSDAPIPTKFAGRPNGVSRYEVAIEACPLSFDVLDGAILVTRTPPSCDFPAADCRVVPAGLWGPLGKSFGQDQIKQLERERGLAESMMRTAFRALLANAGKDKDAIKKIAGEQAGFSSARDALCRNYEGEDIHGFCALRLTQARIFALQAAFDEKAKLLTKPARTMTKRRTATEQNPVPVGNPASQQSSPPSSRVP